MLLPSESMWSGSLTTMWKAEDAKMLNSSGLLGVTESDSRVVIVSSTAASTPRAEVVVLAGQGQKETWPEWLAITR